MKERCFLKVWIDFELKRKKQFGFEEEKDGSHLNKKKMKRSWGYIVLNYFLVTEEIYSIVWGKKNFLKNL